MINKLSINSDTVGAIASSLCLLHCIVTPLIFIIQPLVADTGAPSWWKSMDYVFLLLSFFAVYWSAKNTAKVWMQYALWSFWLALTIAILNEKLEMFSWSEFSIYIPALGLVFLHLYNKKYCQCADEGCCVNTKEEKNG
jgi:Ca2+/Na+ antiporter